MLHITKKHTGKMKDLQSLSTSILCNENCMKRQKIKNSICSKCFAAAMYKRYTNLSKVLEKNTIELTQKITPVDELPTVSPLSNCFRFEAFGDLINEKQVINYFNICKKNPGVNFALWTKNPWIIKNAIETGNEKPGNLIIVLSSFELNKPQTELLKYYTFADKLFTVYDTETIIKEKIEINCGALSCATCQKCYHKNEFTIINEKLK